MTRKLLLYLLAIAAMLPLPAVVASDTVSHDVVIVLDVSKTVRESDRDGRILNGLQQLVNSFDVSTRVRLIRYANDIIDTGSGFDRNANEIAERKSVINRLDKYIEGKTFSNTGAALAKAIEMLYDGNAPRRSIVLVSDNEMEVAIDNKYSDIETGESEKQIEDIILDTSNSYHIYYMNVSYAQNNRNTKLTDTLTDSPVVTRCDLHSTEDIDLQIGWLVNTLKSPVLELLTPKYIDGEWVASNDFTTGEEIELYAFFTQGDELLADLEYLGGFTVTVYYGSTEYEMILAKEQDSFYLMLSFDEPGSHELTVTARNEYTGITYRGVQVLNIGGDTLPHETEPKPESEPSSDVSVFTEVFQSSSFYIALMSFGLALVWGTIKTFILWRKKVRVHSQIEAIIDKTLLVELLDETRVSIRKWERKIPKMEACDLTKLIPQSELSVLQKRTKQNIGAINRIAIENKSAALTVTNNSDMNCYVGRDLIPKDEAFPLAEGQSIEVRRTGELQAISIRVSHLQHELSKEAACQ